MLMQGINQLRGYFQWCLSHGHLWTGRNEKHPDWPGVCVTCGKIAHPRPNWRRFILMGDRIP